MKLPPQLAAMWEVARDLLRGGYPGFVTGGPLAPGEIPVFVLHGLEPAALERQLQHLERNGYTTLTADELLELIEQRRPAPERAVVLSIDDGRGSVWSVGYPLLERFAMRAVVFLVPGRMSARGGPALPHWGDATAGRAAPAAVLGRDRSEHGLLSWEEVETLAASGVFDFQSHSLRHARIHVAPRLAGFVTPGDRHGYPGFDVPLVRERQHELTADALPLGAPILESAPRLTDAARFLEDPEPRAACAAHVEANGGAHFFSRRGWRAALRHVWERAPGRAAGASEAPAAREAAWREELAGSRSAIEAHIGRPVRHMCFPWHASCDASERLAHELGYQHLWCGKLPGTPITRPGHDPRRIARVGEDFLLRLPGAGRVSLRSVLLAKLGRRLSGAS